jgi:hypothetical protein
MAEFKARIAQLMRGRAGGEAYSVIGASHAHSCVVRKPTDRGYHPADKTTKKPRARS